jgi:hypothetical protein
VLAVARGDLDPLTASLQTETAEHVGDGAVEVVGEPGAAGDDVVPGSSTAVEPPGDAERAEG